MFQVGREYRVVIGRDGFGNREGVLIDVDGPIFTVDVEGTHTTFHMAAVTLVELIDRELEVARTDAWISSLAT